MKDQALFEQRDAQILGVSRDDLAAHTRFAQATGARFPLLSDRDGQVSKAYGAGMPLIPLSQRKLFLIDKQGLIRLVVDGMPRHEDLFRELDRLQEGAAPTM